MAAAPTTGGLGLSWGVLVALLGLVAVCAASPAAAQQDASFTVQGAVANGTAGATRPDALKVNLFAFTVDAIVGSWETEADATGSFVFEAVPAMPDASYALLVDYQDVTYSARVTLTEGQGTVSQDVAIYESVSVDPGLRFEQTAVVVGDEPGSAGVLSITEIHSIVNPTDRSFAPRADGPGGPAGLLVFGLPPDAFGLTPGLGLDASRVVQIGRGFASLAPVIPGRTEVSYSYRLGFSQSDVRLERTIRYPVDLFRAISPAKGPLLTSPQLPAEEVVTIGERQHRTVTGGPFAPGTALVLTVAGLNVPGGVFANVPAGVPVAGGTALGLLGIGVYWVRAQRSQGRGWEGD